MIALPNYSKLLRRLFLASLIITQGFTGFSKHKTSKSILIETSGSGITDAELIAIKRIGQSTDGKTHIISKNSNPGDRYDILIHLGIASNFQELKTALVKEDSWTLKSIPGDPLRITCLGQNTRGMLYAAYRLADMLQGGQDLNSINLYFEPKIAERYVSFGATTYGRKVFQPAQYYKTLEELPRYGYNGVIIYPGGGTPIGRQSSPVLETEDGIFYIDSDNAKQWKNWFTDIKKYDHDIVMTIPPLIPAGFTSKQIQTFYRGGEEPAGYTDSLKIHFKKFLSLLTKEYPEIDSYMFNSTEGATFGRNERFFGPPADEIPLTNYLANNTKVMTAYFDVLSNFFKGRLDKVFYWTHSFGLTSDGIIQMRNILFRYPEVTIIEDDFWNNNLWPFELPSMNYLPDTLRKTIHTKNPFGLFQIATDGEYYGGGSLPNAYPGSHIRSALDAINRNAKLVIQRLDLHDRTPYGTLFGTMEIIPLAASSQLWSPVIREDIVWQNWAGRRFGVKAAPFVINALKTSKSVIDNGLSANGADLLGVGSEINPKFWKVGLDANHFTLFGKPGQLIVKKSGDDLIKSTEYAKYQMKTRTISISDYRAQMEKAQRSITYALSEIKNAKPYLSSTDFSMLTDIFNNGRNVVTAMTLLGQLAYNANIILRNYDHVKDPKLEFQLAAEKMDEFIKQEALIPEMNDNLKEILKNYQNNLKTKLK